MPAKAKRKADATEEARRRMVDEQIVARGIKDKELLSAMRTIPRHRFVSDDERANAYDDCPLPIGYSQTISQPFIVALMTQALLSGQRETVLEIGTGCGYQSAVLSELFTHVYTIECVRPLGKAAQRRLEALQYNNITFYRRDGSTGLEEKAPFDAILVACAAIEAPSHLLQQLRVGGRMVIPIGAPYMPQVLTLFEKRTPTHTTEQEMCGVRFVPMVTG